MLSILRCADERLASPAVIDRVRELRASCGSVVVVVPTRTQALDVQKTLAHEKLGLRVRVETPVDWVRGQWELFGDGRKVVSKPQRLALMSVLLRRQAGVLATSAGSANYLANLALKGVRSVSEGQPASKSAATIDELLEAYYAQLAALGLVELADVVDRACESVRSLPRPAGFVVAGFAALDELTREMAAGLSAATQVDCVLRDDGVAATAASDEVVRQLMARGLDPEITAIPAVPKAPADPELAELSRTIFGDSEAAPIAPTGAVSLLYPAGPAAEAEIALQAVKRLADEGADSIVVAHPQAERLWRELAPKLVGAGLAGSFSSYVRIADTPVCRAALSWMEFVLARKDDVLPTLEAQSISWDGATGRDLWALRDGLIGKKPGWWPPKGVVDFLLSEASGVATTAAWSLDELWRKNRALSTQEVIRTLLDPEATSPQCAQATQLLADGRPVEALQVLAEAAGAHPMTARILGKMAAALEQAGEVCEPSDIELIRTVVASQSIALNLAVGPTQGPHVVVTSVRALAQMEARSADAVVYLGLDSETSPVERADTALNVLLDRLGVEPMPDGLRSTEVAFSRAIAVARRRLVLGRVRFDEQSKKTYPALPLTELLLRYPAGVLEDSALQQPEDALVENLFGASAAPKPTCIDARSELLSAEAEAAVHFLAVRPGRPFVLSPTQIEAYIDCPRRWLVEKKLGLDDIDRDLGGLELGSFTHEVMERVYSWLIERRTSVNPGTLTKAKALLDEAFEVHLREQAEVGEGASQNPLISRNVFNDNAIQKLHDDLSAYLEVEAGRFEGFRPIACECRFGYEGVVLPQFTYAGARFAGVIDRIDVNDDTREVIIIDYKRGSGGFAKKYSLREAAWSKTNGPEDYEYILPRKVQALIYATAAKRMIAEGEGPFAGREGYKVVASLYVGLSPSNGPQVMTGAVDGVDPKHPMAKFASAPDWAAQKAKLWGSEKLSYKRERLVRPADVGLESFDLLLEKTEDGVAKAVEGLRAGKADPDPRTYVGGACDFCPLKASCERSLA